MFFGNTMVEMRTYMLVESANEAQISADVYTQG